MNELVLHKLREIRDMAEGIILILEDPESTEEDIRNAENMLVAIPQTVERIQEHRRKENV